LERYVTTLKDRRGEDRSLLIRRDSEGRWLAECRLPGDGLVLDGRSENRRDAVGIVERKLIRRRRRRVISHQHRTCLFIAEASNAMPPRRR
jgi:hypothetical protein